ncbi:hypothetical protein OPQ81_005029 [Rhizoctonia solani]|nr:hypothetical protein OPQ81_005029 [Rhizoctonia solani]
MAHGYIWGGDSPSERLPPAVSVPLLAVSEYLEIPPVATYAGLCLWNFSSCSWTRTSMTSTTSPHSTPSLALQTSRGSTSSPSPSKPAAHPSSPLMLTAIAAAREGDTATVTRCLRAFAERLDDLGTLLHRMNEHCHPTIFYDRIRPFLAGSKNMAEAGLPNGVLYEVDDTGRGQYRQYSGGSNAQSSIIQFFDLVLGVEHRPTGVRAGASADGSASDSDASRGRAPAPQHNFIMEMRKYMPGPHARFLNDVASVANIRDLVEDPGPARGSSVSLTTPVWRC